MNKVSSYGAYNEASDENLVYINVWDYNSDWDISVKENGKSLKVNKVSIYDPLFVLAYYGTRFNDTASPGQNAVLTSHMFSVKASAPDTTLEITVTDDEDNEYKETMVRPKPFTIDEYK